MKKVITAVVLITTLILCACSSSSDASVYQRISTVEAIQMMDELDTYIILDVRSESEFEAQHINGAILIPVSELRSRAEKELPDKDAVIFVYCRAGNRSAEAARLLISMGYTNVYDMGGIGDWPNETVS